MNDAMKDIEELLEILNDPDELMLKLKDVDISVLTQYYFSKRLKTSVIFLLLVTKSFWKK